MKINSLKEKMHPGFKAISIDKEKNKRLKQRFKPDSILQHKNLALFACMFFSVVDAIAFFSIFDNILASKSELKMIFVIALGILSNSLPLIIDHLTKAYIFRLTPTPRKILLGGIIMTIMAYVMINYTSFQLRWAVKDVIDVSANQNGFQSNQDLSHPYTSSLAIFMTVTPIVTSLLTYLLASLSNPFNNKLYKLEMNRLMTEEVLIQLKAALTQFTSEYSYIERLQQEEKSKYFTAFHTIQRQKDYYKTYVRLCLAQHLADASTTSIINSASKDITRLPLKSPYTSDNNITEIYPASSNN